MRRSFFAIASCRARRRSRLRRARAGLHPGAIIGQRRIDRHFFIRRSTRMGITSGRQCILSLDTPSIFHHYWIFAITPYGFGRRRSALKKDLKVRQSARKDTSRGAEWGCDFGHRRAIGPFQRVWESRGCSSGMPALNEMHFRKRFNEVSRNTVRAIVDTRTQAERARPAADTGKNSKSI